MEYTKLENTAWMSPELVLNEWAWVMPSAVCIPGFLMKNKAARFLLLGLIDFTINLGIYRRN
jgi:hypothetical protein